MQQTRRVLILNISIIYVCVNLLFNVIIYIIKIIYYIYITICNCSSNFFDFKYIKSQLKCKKAVIKISQNLFATTILWLFTNTDRLQGR